MLMWGCSPRIDCQSLIKQAVDAERTNRPPCPASPQDFPECKGKADLLQEIKKAESETSEWKNKYEEINKEYTACNNKKCLQPEDIPEVKLDENSITHIVYKGRYFYDRENCPLSQENCESFLKNYKGDWKKDCNKSCLFTWDACFSNFPNISQCFNGQNPTPPVCPTFNIENCPAIYINDEIFTAVSANQLIKPLQSWDYANIARGSWEQIGKVMNWTYPYPITPNCDDCNNAHSAADMTTYNACTSKFKNLSITTCPAGKRITFSQWIEIGKAENWLPYLERDLRNYVSREICASKFNITPIQTENTRFWWQYTGQNSQMQTENTGSGVQTSWNDCKRAFPDITNSSSQTRAAKFKTSSANWFVKIGEKIGGYVDDFWDIYDEHSYAIIATVIIAAFIGIGLTGYTIHLKRVTWNMIRYGNMMWIKFGAPRSNLLRYISLIFNVNKDDTYNKEKTVRAIIGFLQDLEAKIFEAGNKRYFKLLDTLQISRETPDDTVIQMANQLLDKIPKVP